jgi:hypothetical protein
MVQLVNQYPTIVVILIHLEIDPKIIKYKNQIQNKK